jgi:acyl carrier protein
MRGQIESDLRRFVIEQFLYGDDSRQFSNEDSFLGQGLIDSMGVISLITHVQEKYLIAVPNNEVIPENWDSVSRLAAYVRRKMALAR